MATRSVQAGFTLIEITIVMAISASLMVIALLGFSTLRGQAQFSASVERLKELVLVKRQEALATIKLSGGADAGNVTFGRILTFTPGSSNVIVETLYTANNDAPTAGQPVRVLASETHTITVPWGVVYVNSSRGGARIQVAYVRSSVDGALQTAVSPNGGWGGPPYQYGNFAPNGAAVNLNFQDPSGRRAFLTIDPGNNGVTRTFQ